MNCSLVKGLAFGLAAVAISYAQVDFKADVINFRDATKDGMTTTHYGRLSVNSKYQGLYSVHTGTASTDYIAVYGQSTPVANWGVGGSFYGGYTGVRGYASMSGEGTRYGGYFYANAGGSGSRYGSYSSAYGTPATGSIMTNYGVYTGAGNGTYNYGIYSYASTATANTYSGYFNGNVYISGTLTNPSDERLKENIKELNNSLPLIMQLKPKTYNYTNDMVEKSALPRGKRMGLIAQDVEEILPELVKEIAEPVANDDKNAKEVKVKTFKSVDYISLIPVLIGAIQEQQKQIDVLTAEIAKIKNQ